MALAQIELRDGRRQVPPQSSVYSTSREACRVSQFLVSAGAGLIRYLLEANKKESIQCFRRTE